MSETLESILSATLTLAIVALAGTIIYDRFSSERAADSERPEDVSEHWTELRAGGLRIGPANARVEIVEFTDFECPFCQSNKKDLDIIRGAHPDDVAVIYHHFPIESLHRFAQISAEAVECANDQGRARQMIDLVFATQDSLGLIAWPTLATRAGVPDSSQLSDCLTSNRHRPKVLSQRAFGESLGVTGTPTLIINGWKLPGAMHPDTVRSYVEAFLAGTDPVAARR